MTDHSRAPAVSIVLPFHNAGDTLQECFDSIRRQTFTDFEALLLDDGSDDSSTALVRKLSGEDPRLRLIEPGRVGLVASLNLGIARARASLIARMDADDIMHPDRLRLQEKFMRDNPDIALAGCQVEPFPEDGIRNGYREYVQWLNNCIEPEDIAANLYVESPLAHPSVMMRRSDVEAVGGYVDGPFPEDYDLWLRMHAAGCRMAKVRQMLLWWRDRPDRTSRMDPRYSSEAFDSLRARYLAKDARLHSRRHLVVWGGGRTTRLRVRRLLEQGVRPAAWVDVDPRRIGMKIWGLPVHPYEWLEREPRPFVLVYVRNHGARDEATRALETWGYKAGLDYLAVG